MEKSEIRQIMKQKRRALTEDEIWEKSKAISESLFKTKEFTEAKTVIIYVIIRRGIYGNDNAAAF